MVTLVRPPDLSVILPMYCNRDTIDLLYHRISSALDLAGIRFELIFVDDRCPQKSFELVKLLAKKDSRVNLIIMEHNVGQNDAILAGFSVADGVVMASMDADLQDPPDALPSLFLMLQQGYDVVFGGRSGAYEVKHRLITSRLYKWLMHLITGVPADAGLFFVIKKDLAQKLIALSNFNTHIIPMIGVSGAKTISISAPRSVRPSGVSAYSSRKRLSMGLNALKWVIEHKLKLHKQRAAIENHSRFPIELKFGAKFNTL